VAALSQALVTESSVALPPQVERSQCSSISFVQSTSMDTLLSRRNM
jgi:hypothetical protein